MLAGSTSGLRYVCFQPSCRLLRSPALFAMGRLTVPALPLHSTVSSAAHLHRLQSVSQVQDGQGSAEPVVTNSYLGYHVCLLPPAPSTLAHSSSFPGVQTAPAGARGARQVDGVDVPGVAQNHHPAKQKCPAQRRRTLRWVMLTTKSPRRAWSAYQELLSYRVAIPPHLLHQLVRLLSSTRPRTRTLFLQLLSVLKTLHMNHGRLRLWEWNTLINAAGKQWRKTRLEDYEHSLGIFERRGSLPAGEDASPAPAVDLCLPQQEPDIWTYNILLSVACCSASPLILRHASSLLHTSGISPNRYTHLCLLRYFAVHEDLKSVHSTLRKMRQQGFEVGLDGINACLWAYARNGRLNVALRIYRALRSNVDPIPHLGEHDDSCYIRDTIGLDILGSEPDEITYTMMIQALAYHGDLTNALGVFVEMLSTPNREASARTNSSTVSPGCYKPSMAAFRALFLGFARHGRGPADCTAGAELFLSPQVLWDLETLEAVFAAFLRTPNLPKPTAPIFYWIVVAFDKTSGRDSDKLREVWTKLEAKYDGNWGGRLARIKRSIFFSDDECTVVIPHNTS